MENVVYILGGARTPMGTYVGPLREFSATDLGVLAAKGALERTRVQPEWIDHVVIGNVLQTSADAIYAARHVALRSGLPQEVPALVVNRLCGSGIEAAAQASHLIRLGEAHIVLTGGIESMSQAPHVVRGARTALTDTYCGCPMAITAENCAATYGIRREDQDRYALRSQQLAARAWSEGRLAEEVIAVEIKDRKSRTVFDRDDHLRPETTLEGLANLAPVFKKDGSVTAGNASGIVDGGAALILASAEAVRRRALSPIGRLVDAVSIGVDPALMGMGPVPAIRRLLARTDTALDAIDLFEINEAFAAQYLSVEQALGLDREKVNVNGGAIALGHPLGMSGTRLILTLLMEMRRRRARRGIASACIGGGQGIAAMVESA
jgi:acetyl-CoA acetyltransferase family protein